MIKHDYMACAGNICQTDPENHLRNWWPGEAVCTAKPYTQWQKVQIRLNKLLLKGKLKYPNTYYFIKTLSKARVMAGSKGLAV